MTVAKPSSHRSHHRGGRHACIGFPAEMTAPDADALSATSISANVGAGLALGVGGFNIGAQAPIAAPVNVGIAAPINVQAQAGCVALGFCSNSGGDPQATAGTQSNGTLNQATQNQTTGGTTVTATNAQVSSSAATSNGNVTQTNQLSGDTTVTAGATSGTAGSANAHTTTNGVAGNNVAQSPSKTNRSDDAGTNSTNHTGNEGTNSNTNDGGNTTNDN